jgi:hypothetical protein
MLDFCPVESDLNRHLKTQDASEARYAAAESETSGTDFEAMARDWLMSDRVENFYPDWPRDMSGTDVLFEFIACTDAVAAVSIAKVLFRQDKTEENQLCQHKLDILVEEYAEKFKEREIRGLLS